MEVKRGSDGSGTLLRVAIQIGNSNYLQKLDISRPMEDIIEELCQQWQIPGPSSEMGLWTVDGCIHDGTKFMSDRNKSLVKPGAMLILKQCPRKLCATLIDNLLDNHEDGLAAIASQSKDTEILKVLCNEKAHELVFGILEQNFKIGLWVDGIKFILRLYTKRLIKKIPVKIINKLLITVAHAMETHEDFLVKGLSLLVAVRRYGRLRYQNELFGHLEVLILMRDKPKLQEAALEMLNYLVLFPNNEEEEVEAMKRVVNQKVVGLICDSILRETPSKSMQQKLYQYETLVLRPYWTKKVTKVLNNDPEIEIVRRLTDRAKKGELTYNTGRRRLFSEGEQKLSEAWKKPSVAPSTPRVSQRNSIIQAASTLKNALTPSPRKLQRFASCAGTQDTTSSPAIEFYFPGPIFYVPLPQPSPIAKKKSASAQNLSTLMDFARPSSKEIASNDPALSMRTFSQLTLCNLKYQAANYPAQYEQWALTKARRRLFAEKLTHLVCRLLDIGRPRPVDSPGENYHPLLFFTYPFIEEELFCEVFAQYEKTSREMKARVEKDVIKVLTVVSEQLGCALNPRPSYFKPAKHFHKPKTMEELRDVLSLIHYENIAEKRRMEREDRMKYDLRNKPLFLEYRAECTPEILELIKKQRMTFVRKGDHLLKVNGKGEILPNALEYLRLTANGDHLIIGDCFKMPEKCNHTRQLAVSEIIDISAGKQSKFYKDVFTQNEYGSKTRPPPKHWECFFSLKLRDHSYVNFCAWSIEIMHCWIDALNLILGKPMTSATMESEMKDFLDLSVRLKFLDIEELPLPDDPPTVPPPPANYNFCIGPKTKSHKTELTSHKNITLV